MLWSSEGKAKMTEYKPCPKCGKLEQDLLTGYWSLRGDGKKAVFCHLCDQKTSKKIYGDEPPPSPFGTGVDNLDLERYVNEPRLKGDYLITHDPHFPLHHGECWRHAQLICEKFQIKQMIIPGDGVELYWQSNFLKDDAIGLGSWEQEKERVKNTLEWIGGWMRRVDWLPGNHELRWWKRMLQGGGKAAQEELWTIVSKDVKPSIKRKFHFHLYPYAIINNSWFICHPNMTSIIPGRVPDRLSSKYMVQELVRMLQNGIVPKNWQMGVVAGHGHLGGEATDVSGSFQVADGMIMADGDLFNYHKLKLNARPEWRLGFHILKDNYLYRFPERNTDWKFWLS